MQKTGYGEDVAFVGGVLRAVDDAADEYPQRAFQVVGPQPVAGIGKDPLLFVEGQQVSQQKQIRFGGRAFLLQVEDAKVLAVAVVIKMAVGIVKGDGLAILG